VWVEVVEGWCFAGFMDEDEEKLGPGVQTSSEGIVVGDGGVKSQQFAEEVLEGGE